MEALELTAFLYVVQPTSTTQKVTHAYTHKTTGIGHKYGRTRGVGRPRTTYFCVWSALPLVSGHWRPLSARVSVLQGDTYTVSIIYKVFARQPRARTCTVHE